MKQSDVILQEPLGFSILLGSKGWLTIEGWILGIFKVLAILRMKHFEGMDMSISSLLSLSDNSCNMYSYLH